MMRSVLTKLVALALACALAAAAMHYPASKVVLAACIAGYAALLWFRPEAWLLTVPALLPILDFAPWTGWFFLEELDLLLLATAAIGYWRIGASPPCADLPRFFVVLLGLVSCAFAIAAAIGLLPLPAVDANSFANYSSSFNSLRIAKGFAWALVLLPLLRRSAGPGLVNLQRYFVPGMLLGLTGACLAVVWERAVFPGLLNFASDYRPTAPFSAMHTGGAALDAYLAISFPFVAIWLLGARSRIELALALLLLPLGCYAGLTTFSRDIYLAFGCSGAIVAALTLAHRLRRGTVRKRALAGSAILLAIVAYGLVQLFATSGYRGLLAALVLTSAAVILGAVEQRLTRIGLFAGAALALALADIGLFFYSGSSALGGVSKGPYLGFILSAGVFALGVFLLFFGPGNKKSTGFALAAAAFPGVALATGLVAYHWGGNAAWGDAAVMVAIACGLIAVNRSLPDPIWRLDRNTLTLTFFCVIVFSTLIPVAGSYYLGTRLATVGDDLGVRIRHWTEALEMMSPDWQTSAFGMGLGRYPDTYVWKNMQGELPGSHRYETEGNNLFLRLGGPKYAIGYGDVLRVLQHVDLSQGSRYRLSLDIRRSTKAAQIHVSICERWLLYPQNCVPARLKLLPADGAWHHYEVALEPGPLAARSGLLRPPTQLEIAAEGANASIDVDNVSLRDLGGPELISNGSFSNANDYWFFSSDRNHMPWHVKNFVVNTIFEQGWLGLVVLSLLICYVAGDLAVRGLHGDLSASVYLAALAGFLVVGMFDSLFDVPRLTLVFFMVLVVAVLRPAKVHAVRRNGTVGRKSRLPPSPSSAVPG
jgi:hypothetical protein